MSNLKQFTEQETEAYYDSSDEIYQSFWDKNGGLHWGYFEPDNQNDFQKASDRLTELMIDKAGIDKSSKVLDVGCGNGKVTIEVAQKCLCEIDGIDLSGVRIKNAQAKLSELTQDVRGLVSFQKNSATQLPYKDKSFTHIWSQATIYHTHDKEKVIQEIYRILEQDGIFIFDDLLKPKEAISDEAKKYVYERLLFDTPFSFTSYQNFLKQTGFEILEAQDLSVHLKKSYEALAGILLNRIENNEAGKYKAKYQELAKAYRKTSKAVDNQEIGWGLFVCKKSVK